MKPTFRRKLIVYTIVLIVLTTIGSAIGASFLILEQTRLENQDRLEKALIGFQQDFNLKIKNLDQKFEVFFSDRQRTRVFVFTIMNYPWLQEIPRREIEKFSKDLMPGQIAFYFKTKKSNVEALRYYYSSNLKGIVAVDYGKVPGQHVLFTQGNADYISHISKIIKDPKLFPEIYSPSNQKHQLVIQGDNIILESHFHYTNQSYHGLDSDVLINSHIGYFILKKRLGLKLEDLDNRMGVRFNIYDVTGQPGDGAVPMYPLELDKTGKLDSKNNIVTISDRNGEHYDGLVSSLTYGGKIIGYVSVTIPQKATAQKIKETLLMLGLVALAVLVITMNASVFIVRRYTFPLVELSHLMMDFSEALSNRPKLLQSFSGQHQEQTKEDIDLFSRWFSEDLHQTVSQLVRARTTEIQELEDSFIQMIEVIKDQTLIIEKQNRSLAQKVDLIEKQNQKLQHIDQLKDEFLANTSHELRTPLNGIIGIAESLAEGVAGKLSSQQSMNLSMVITSGRRLSILIKDLLDFSKMKHKNLEIYRKSVNLKSLSSLVLELSHYALGAKPITLVNEIADDSLFVFADEDRLEQILYNLVGNAIKFTHEGKVILRADKLDRIVRISVIDTGIGIKKEHQERVFLNFEQLAETVEQRYGGTGLGLSISKYLVELHGGKLEINSEEHLGSTFSFTLPISEKPGMESLPVNGGNSIQCSNSGIFLKSDDQITPSELTISDEQLLFNREKKILIVDDDRINLQVLHNYLLLQQYQIELAHDGFSALESIDRSVPDLVLLDLMMPKISGYRVCEKIRKQYDLLTLPIIILTAKHQIKSLVYSFQVGANDYLNKPFHKEELFARVNTHLRAKEATERLLENQMLKNEIVTHKAAKNQLLAYQKNLVHIINYTEESIICLSDEGKITLFNNSSENLFGYLNEEVVGEELSLLFPSPFIQSLYQRVLPSSGKLEVVPEDLKNFKVIGLRKDNSEFIAEASIVSLKLNSGFMLTLIIHRVKSEIQNGDPYNLKLNPSNPFVSDQKDFAGEHPNQMVSLGGEVLQNKQRIEKLEHLFQAVTDFVKNNGTEFFERIIPSNHSSKPNGFSQNEKLRKKLVEILSLSVSIWEMYTGKSKVELAEESKLWRVYLDRGIFTVRTMDKYLDLSTLPKKPRWKTVLMTATYILENCSLETSIKSKLETQLLQLRNLLTENVQEQFI